MGFLNKSAILFILIFISLSFVSATIEKTATPIQSGGTLLCREGQRCDSIFQKYSQISLSDCGFMGSSCWFGNQGTQLVDLQLIKNTDSCAGDCSATIDLSLYQDAPLIDAVRFYLVDGETTTLSNINSYQVYIKTGETTQEVNDYQDICNQQSYPNGSIINNCHQEVSGVHEEVIPVWTPYQIGETMSAGDYEVKLSGTKDRDKTYDWQIQSQGEWITDWAYWTAVNPTHYWKFNEASGTAFDTIGTMNLSNTNFLYKTGKLNNAINSSINTDYFTAVQTDKSLAFDKGDFTINVWIAPTNNTAKDAGAIITTQNAYFSSGAWELAVWYNLNCSIALRYASGAVEFGGTSNLCYSGWHMITVTKKSDNLTFWKDGIIESSFEDINNYSYATGNMSIGFQGDGGASQENYIGGIDDLSIYKGYAFNSSDISSIYNSGFGRELDSFSSQTTSNLDAPIDYLNITSDYKDTNPILDFNWTSIPTNTNITNWTLSIWYSNGSIQSKHITTGLSITTTTSLGYSFNISNLTDDIYNWGVNVCGIELNGTQACFGSQTNRTFSQNTSIQFGLCNSTLNVQYLNITFKDSATATYINASITSASFIYWVDSPSNNRTYTFSELGNNYSYIFCGSPTSSSFSVLSNIAYKQTPNYPERINSNSYFLTNSTNNTILYLLGTGGGIYSSYQVLNPYKQTLQNAFIEVSDSTGIVTSGHTDSSGVVTFFLNPLLTYNFTVSYAGYPTILATINPALTQYTFQFELSSQQSTNYISGVSIGTSPNLDTLDANTTYNFSLSIGSTVYTINSFGYVISNSSGSILAFNSSSSNGGSISQMINVDENKGILMNYYYIINGTYNNASINWIVLTQGATEGSILNLITDIKAYVAVGFFGLDNFGLGIIIFAIIFIYTGVICWKFGFNTGASAMAILWSGVALFDVGLGLMDNLNPIGAVPHFPTIIIGVIAIVLLFQEGTR